MGEGVFKAEIRANQMTLYFLDSNILMYTLGASHPFKAPCIKILERIRTAKIHVCTNTEILQEILYRYHSIGKKNIAHQTCELLKDIADPILPVTLEDITRAMSLMDQYPVPVRDAIHTATMLNNDIRHIISTDTHFDEIQGITRIQPN